MLSPTTTVETCDSLLATEPTSPSLVAPDARTAEILPALGHHIAQTLTALVHHRDDAQRALDELDELEHEPAGTAKRSNLQRRFFRAIGIHGLARVTARLIATRHELQREAPLSPLIAAINSELAELDRWRHSAHMQLVRTTRGK